MSSRSLTSTAAHRLAQSTLKPASLAQGSSRLASTTAHPSRPAKPLFCPARPARLARFPTTLPTRTFSSTAARASSSKPESVRDLEPDNGLYYHPTTINVSDGQTQTQTNTWALSYLRQPPSSPESKAIVAFLLPPKHSPKINLHAEDPATYIRDNPDRISVNPDFMRLLHDTLKHDAVPTDDLLDFEASTRKSGWAHLTDLRHPLNPGRIATPESIIASVAFVDGQLQIDSYEANASYRLVTGYEGPMHLRPNWQELIRQKVRDLN
ncbi:uncharacterized protein PFL1_00483 [Pseudozyma flocculosa PF-1]|uniref:Uncharacterized protein n=1 Tax=Pseudozyma flocculosa TaxID=84751 RepID=A0A5C3ERB6_9BASI|nr:uncharacterized protein PFL1_00483 [Pseudozyma flocculosa PF-1]EPQ32286.1 hypothetical protein PFL1_00483 [Pseudozyma flocculosa PF-1]SPO34758.1 uncharacterized protein PSFLO_00229 [Pseudozyma flocculosa]